MYEVVPCKFIDLVEDFDCLHENVINGRKKKNEVTEGDVIEHNALLKQPLNFYSGYI
jgi:hypothetical protein